MKTGKALLLGINLALFVSSPVFADIVDDSLNFNNTEVSGSNSPATSDDAAALVINPGGIGIRGEGELFFSNSITGLQQTNLLATFGNFNLGFQQFTPVGTVLKPMRKYIVGTGYPIFDGLSFGLTYYNIQSTDGSNISTSSVDLGVLTRPMDFLSVGFVIRNLTTPFFDQTPINRTYVGSLGFRPGGSDRITATLDGEWVEGAPFERMRARLGLETELIDGINLRGKVYTDPKFTQLAWSLDLGLTFPYIGVGYFRMQDTKSPLVRDAAYAKLSLNKNRTLFERANSRLAEINFDGVINANKVINTGLFSVERNDSVFDYLQFISNAEKDRDIAGIVLNMQNFGIGMGSAEEIRNRLTEFKKSGKKVIAYVRALDLRDYYLASVADHIIMHPVGEIDLMGLSATNYYFKGLLDKAGVEAQYEKYGKFKSATEPFTRKDASEADELQTKVMLEDFFNSLTDPVVAKRGIDKEKLKTIIDNKPMLSATEARDLKLVDEVAYYDEVGKMTAGYYNLKGEFPLTEIAKRDYREYKWKDNNKVAIINAGGTIVEGRSTTDFLSGETTLGSETISRMLAKARKDDDIKAVVLRVDSGGGSALASDIIARELQLFKEAKKPIVVSMANVAASGGYWIATHADKIVANEKTLTGSIGVFTGKLNFAGLFDKLGITTETFKIGEHADAMSQARPLTEEESKILNDSAAAIYRTFLERVSAGRKLAVAEVEELAQGRVYSGGRAKDLKLVDEIGGLDRAVEIAKSLADIKDAKAINMEQGLDVISQLATDPKQAFYPLIMMKLFSENKVLAIMPNMDLP